MLSYLFWNWFINCRLAFFGFTTACRNNGVCGKQLLWLVALWSMSGVACTLIPHLTRLWLIYFHPYRGGNFDTSADCISLSVSCIWKKKKIDNVSSELGFNGFRWGVTLGMTSPSGRLLKMRLDLRQGWWIMHKVLPRPLMCFRYPYIVRVYPCGFWFCF